jgi:hypothetical protein
MRFEMRYAAAAERAVRCCLHHAMSHRRTMMAMIMSDDRRS